MHRRTLYGVLFFFGLTALAPLIALGAGESDIGKLLDQRLNGETANQAEQERAGIAKGKRVAILTEGNAVLQDIDALQAAIERWENQMKAILTSAEGQALAGNPVSVEDFIHLQEAKRYPLSQAEGLRSQVQSMLSPLQTAGEGSLYIPTDALVVEIQSAGEKVKGALAEYDRLQAKWRVLLQRVRGIQVSANAPTLAMAIDQVKDEQAQRELDAQQIARNKTNDEYQKQIAEEEARKQAELKKKEIERLKQEQENIRQQAALASQDAEHQRLLKEASNPVLARKYAPFLAKTNVILTYRRSLSWPTSDVWKKVAEPSPLSYAMISNYTWYDHRPGHDQDGEKNFMNIASNPHNDRPHWAYPSSGAEWAEAKKRYEEFEKYAPLWIELGLLKP